MNLTDIVTPDELREFLDKAMVRDPGDVENQIKWMERANRLEPLLKIFASTLPNDEDRLQKWHLLAVVVALDEILEFATQKGRVQ